MQHGTCRRGCLPFGSRYDNHVEAFLVFLQLVVGDAAADIENDSVW